MTSPWPASARVVCVVQAVVSLDVLPGEDKLLSASTDGTALVWLVTGGLLGAHPAAPSAVSRQPSAVSRQPSAVSRQPSAVRRPALTGLCRSQAC